MIKSLNSWEISTSDSIKTRSNPGAITADLLDHIKPAVRKKLDMLIIHTCANDHGENLNTIQKVQKCDQRH